MKPFVIALALALTSAGAAVAAPSLKTITAQDTDIRDFIQEVARLADLTVIVDPRVRGSVSVSAEGLTRDDLLHLMVATLRTQGYAAVPSVGGAYRIFPIEDQVQRSTAVRLTQPDAGSQRL